LRNGRGSGWAAPRSSIVRLRKVYSPAGTPGRTAAQWALVSFIGQVLGTPAASKPCVGCGICPAGKAGQVRGGGSNSASTQGAVRKYGSFSGRGASFDSSATCTFARPEMPTWA
jgi:hypothetical protein